MSKNLQISVYLDYYGTMLTDKQRDLAEMYYNEDLSLGEIAELTGITRQGVHDSLKRTEQILLDFENNIKLVEKSQNMMKVMHSFKQKSSELLALVKQLNSPYTVVEQIEGLQELTARYLKKYE